MNFYDMEVVEEEAFLKWKEEVNDQYPGKGKALFQVSWERESVGLFNHETDKLFGNTFGDNIRTGSWRALFSYEFKLNLIELQGFFGNLETLKLILSCEHYILFT